MATSVRTLEDFDTLPVPSATHPGTIYRVTEDGCQCEFFQLYHGNPPCRHELARALERLKAKNAYLMEAHAWGPEVVDTWEDVLGRFHLFSTVESNWLAALTLSLAVDATRGITADDVYEAVGVFQRDPRILGAVLGGLKKRGYLQAIGMTTSKRKGNHAKHEAIWAITEAGRGFLEELT